MRMRICDRMLYFMVPVLAHAVFGRSDVARGK